MAKPTTCAVITEEIGMLLTFCKELVIKLGLFAFLLGMTAGATDKDVQLCDISYVSPSAVPSRSLLRSFTESAPRTLTGGSSSVPWDLQNLGSLTACPLRYNNLTQMSAYKAFHKKNRSNSSAPNFFSNVTEAQRICAVGKTVAWDRFSQMQMAFMVVISLHLAVIVLRDLFVWFGPRVEKPIPELICTLTIFASMTLGLYHAYSFYEGYAMTSTDFSFTCLFHLEKFMPIMRFLSIIIIILLMLFDQLIAIFLSCRCCGSVKYAFIRKYTEKGFEEKQLYSLEPYGKQIRGTSLSVNGGKNIYSR